MEYQSAAISAAPHNIQDQRVKPPIMAYYHKNVSKPTAKSQEYG